MSISYPLDSKTLLKNIYETLLTDVLRYANVRGQLSIKNLAMTLSEYLKSQDRGALIALARAVGAHPPDVSNWKTGERPVPAHRCLAIESATHGAVSRRDLRPDDWQSFWPETDKAAA